MPEPLLFRCRHCAADYRIFKVEVDTPAVETVIGCLICDRPMPSGEGCYIFKYFLVDGPSTTTHQGAIGRTQPSGRATKLLLVILRFLASHDVCGAVILSSART